MRFRTVDIIWAVTVLSLSLGLFYQSRHYATDMHEIRKSVSEMRAQYGIMGERIKQVSDYARKQEDAAYHHSRAHLNEHEKVFHGRD